MCLEDNKNKQNNRARQLVNSPAFLIVLKQENLPRWQVLLFLQKGMKEKEAYSLLNSMLSQPLSNDAPVDSRPARKIGRATIFW
jgi:hypothetical protein